MAVATSPCLFEMSVDKAAGARAYTGSCNNGMIFIAGVSLELVAHNTVCVSSSQVLVPRLNPQPVLAPNTWFRYFLTNVKFKFVMITVLGIVMGV